MGVVLTTTAALCLGIVLWALGLSGLDGLLIAIAIVLVSIGLHSVLPSLPGRRG
jgi:flagellin-like protein